jgi:hypothetical protein
VWECPEFRKGEACKSDIRDADRHNDRVLEGTCKPDCNCVVAEAPKALDEYYYGTWR